MKHLILLLSSLIMLSASFCSCKPDTDSYKSQEKPPIENPDNNEPPKTTNSMKVTIGNRVFMATLTPSATVTEFKAMLPLTLTMSDYNSNEKVANLPGNLITNATNAVTIQTGDIMLYGSNSLVLFYETFSTSYSYTRIGKIDNINGLKEALGTSSVTIKFEINVDLETVYH